MAENIVVGEEHQQRRNTNNGEWIDMELIINNHVLKLYNRVEVSLAYNSVTSTFGMRLYFDPGDAKHKAIFRPLQYLPCRLYHGGVLLLTGVVTCQRYSSAGDPPRALVEVTGYAKTGVLQNSMCINTDNTEGNGGIVAMTNGNGCTWTGASLDYTGLTLQQIVNTVCGWYNIDVVVDQILLDDDTFATTYDKAVATTADNDKPNQPSNDITVLDFLKSLCQQKNVVLSHDRHGRLLLTRAKVDKIVTTSETLVASYRDEPTPRNYLMSVPDVTGIVTKTNVNYVNRAVLYDFNESNHNTAWTSMELQCDGEDMHRLIQVVGQSELDDANALDNSVLNPFVPKDTRRFYRQIKTNSSNTDTEDSARSVLGDEIGNIVLTIEVPKWTLGGNMIVPNQLVTVTNQDLYLYKKTRWFIKAVDLNGDEKTETATLTCVVPATFGEDDVVNDYW